MQGDQANPTGAPDDEASGGAGRNGKNARAWVRALPLAALVLAALAAVFVLDIGQWLSFRTLSENHAQIKAYAQNPAAPLLFVLLYALVIALSIPGGTILTLAGGLLFGIALGTALVVAGATLGALAIFLAARTALADALKARAGPKLAQMRDGFEKNAFSYLLFLRLVPLFPFWLVNIVPALLGMRTAPYALATAIGIIPGSAVYASVGNGLSSVLERDETPDLSIIFEPQVLLPILALALLALVPVAVQRKRAAKARAAP